MVNKSDDMTDDEKIHSAMINSYDVIINNMSVEGIITEGNGVAFFAHDFQSELDSEIISDMIGYFVSIEEYEKCTKLDELLKSLPNE